MRNVDSTKRDLPRSAIQQSVGGEVQRDSSNHIFLDVDPDCFRIFLITYMRWLCLKINQSPPYCQAQMWRLWSIILSYLPLPLFPLVMIMATLLLLLRLRSHRLGAIDYQKRISFTFTPIRYDRIIPRKEGYELKKDLKSPTQTVSTMSLSLSKLVDTR